MKRRQFLAASGALAAAATTRPAIAADAPAPAAAIAARPNPIGVSTYSFWGFRRDELRPIEPCIEHAARMGFDGVEILQVQLTSTANGGPVDIVPDGSIVPKKQTKMKVRTLGVAFQSGNTLLPIAANWSINGSAWSQFFYDYGPNVDPSEVLVERTVNKGDRINFGARGRTNKWLPFHSTGNYDQYVTVLKNGDTPPDYAPAYDQGDIVSFMRPYIDGSGKVEIGPRDLIVLFECSTSSPGSRYFDMQDIVLLVTFEDIETSD